MTCVNFKKYKKTKTISHCYYSFTSSGKNKATGAIEAARSNNAMLHGTRKSEDQVLSGLPDWAEATSLPASRTVSKNFDGQVSNKSVPQSKNA